VVGRAGKRLRVLRGGSFNNNPRNARCAYRNYNHPNNDWNNNGFRVVVVASHTPRVDGRGARTAPLPRPEMPRVRGRTVEAEL
jgi:hypothetical protein